MVKNIGSAIGIGLFSLLAAIPIGAQEVATLALRNGERPAGELIDMNASGLILRINGQDRAYPMGEVTAIEFSVGGVPRDAQTRIDSGQPFVLLRNGQVIEGRISDIAGTHPLRVTIDTASGAREFNSNEIAQVWVNPASRAASTVSSEASSGSSATTMPASSLVIPANVAWTPTGVAIAGQTTLAVAATGDIMIAPNVSSGIAGNVAQAPPNAQYPVRNAPGGALIGRVGNGTPFLIGSTDRVTVRGSGMLMVGINDDNVTDNTGNFTVSVRRASR
jgi:hypothetical protein